jgi:hypothetical protein
MATHSSTISERASVAAQSNRGRYCFHGIREVAIRNSDIAALSTEPTE